MLKYSFKDIADIEFSDKAVEKRRFINSLIQGGSRRMLDSALISEEIAYNELNKINPELVPLYKKIMIINDYLLFTKKEELDDKNPMQGAYVETHLGADGERSTIEAQGIIFPLLLQELIKGLFEVFSAHGLPSDKKKAMYVIKKADFLLAEPWDMRFGTKLWQLIFDRLELSDDTNIVPYVFMELVKLPTEEFNPVMQELFMQTEKGDEIIGKLIEKSKYNDGYQKFKNRINARNIDRSMIADSYFTASELDGYDIDGEEDEKVLTETELDRNNNLEKWYRGYNSIYGSDKTNLIWLTNIEEARTYGNRVEEVVIDKNKIHNIDIDDLYYDFLVPEFGYEDVDDYEDEGSWYPEDGLYVHESDLLLRNGYNCYYFITNNAECICMWDKSPIVSRRELSREEFENIEIYDETLCKGYDDVYD
jgi:hypothetical protein